MPASPPRLLFPGLSQSSLALTICCPSRGTREIRFSRRFDPATVALVPRCGARGRRPRGRDETDFDRRSRPRARESAVLALPISLRTHGWPPPLGGGGRPRRAVDGRAEKGDTPGDTP